MADDKRGLRRNLTNYGAFVELEEGIEGLIHVSQLSNERIDKPADHFQVGQEVEAEVSQVDAKERKIGLSIKALRRSEERQEMESYLQSEREGARFSFDDILRGQLKIGNREKEGSGEEPGADAQGEAEASKN